MKSFQTELMSTSINGHINGPDNVRQGTARRGHAKKERSSVFKIVNKDDIVSGTTDEG